MCPIFEEINASNIVGIGLIAHEITDSILKYCAERSAHLTIIDPVADTTTDRYGNDVEIINKDGWDGLSLLKNYDVVVINMDEDCQHLYNELEAIEKVSEKSNFPIIFFQNLIISDIDVENIEDHKSEKIDSEKNTSYTDYKDVINDFTAQTNRELIFDYLEYNSSGILYENNPEMDEFITRYVDTFSIIESTNRDIINDLEKYRSETNYLETRIDEIKTEFEYKKNKHRSLSQRIFSKFPILYMIRYIPKIGLKTTMINRKGYHAIKNGNLLDMGFYLNRYEDVKLTGKDPIIHYIYHGFNEGRNPSREFDAQYYSERHEDVESSKLNPLVHYALYGIKENRRTYPREDISVSSENGGEIYLNRADMSIEGYINADGENECLETILMLDNETFNIKTNQIVESNDDERCVFKFNIPPTLINEKSHQIRLKDGSTGDTITSKNLILSQPRNFRDLSGFLKNSFVSPMVFAPFGERDKRCFATMEDITKYLTNISENSNEKPLVSVILPVYNSIKTLKNSVDSIFKQSYTNIEIIAVDGGSDDGSYEYLKSIENKNLILIQNNSCKKISAARNVALTAAHGEYVAYINPDCTWDPRYLSAMVGALSKLEDADAVYSGQLLFTENQEHPFAVKYGSLNRSLLENRNYIDLNSLCHKYDLYKMIGGFDESLNKYSDWDWILRTINSMQIYSIPVILSNYHGKRQNPESDKRYLEMFRKKQAERKNDLQTNNKSVEPLNNVSIIIPSYESLEDIQECLNAILQLNINDWVEIIVVDNDSSKPVTDYLTTLESEAKIKLIKNKINYGFTFAVNQGVAIAEEGNDILLMNNDAMIVPGAIKAMQYAAYNLPDCGLVVPKQILPADSDTLNEHVPYASLDYECDVNLSGLFSNMVNVPLFHSGRHVELSFAAFFCVYIKRDVLNDSNGLNAEYGRHYRSDRIYCNYIRHVMNLKIYHIDEASVYHKLQQSTEVLREKSQDEYDIMFTKNQWDEKLAKQFGYNKPLWDF